MKLFKKKKIRKSPTEILESIQDPEKESVFAKYFGENLENISYERYTGKVGPDERKLSNYIRRHGGREHTFLHTHPAVEGEINMAFPSYSDMIRLLANDQMRTSIIAQQDPKTGEVLGYTILRKKKNFSMSLPKNEDYGGRPDLQWFQSPAGLYHNKKWETLEKAGKIYGINYKFIPTKGNKFDRNNLTFRKNERNLEEKVAASIIGLIFVGAVLFSSTTLTGLAISNTNIQTAKVSGAILFLIGIIGSYFYFKKTKK